MKENSQSYIDAIHTIDKLLVLKMTANERSLTLFNRETGEGNECPLYGETHKEVREWYESLVFDWNEVGDVITITWK